MSERRAHVEREVEPRRAWACVLPMDGSFFWVLC